MRQVSTLERPRATLPAGLPPLPAAPRRRPRRWPGCALAAGVAAAPLVLMVVSLLVGGGPRTEGADDALLTLAARDAEGGRVLVGPYSRFGWHHPGPSYLYLLSLPTRLWGGSPTGAWIGASVLATAMAAATVIVVRRWVGATAGWWAAAGVLAVVAGLGPGLFRDPWNPYAVALPILFVVVASALAAAGARGALIWAAVVGSLAVQTHVSTVPVVGGLLLLAGTVQVGRWWRRQLSVADRYRVPVGLPDVGVPVPDGVWWRYRPEVAVAVMVLVLEWLPPLWDEVFGTRNLSGIWAFFASPHAGHSWAQSWRLATAMLGITMVQHHAGIRDGMRDPHPVLIAGIFLAIVALAVGTGMRGRRPEAVWLGVFGLAAAGLGLVSITRIVDAPYRYLLVWITVLPVVPLVGAAVGVGAVLADAAPTRPRTRRVERLGERPSERRSWAELRWLAPERSPVPPAAIDSSTLAGLPRVAATWRSPSASPLSTRLAALRRPAVLLPVAAVALTAALALHGVTTAKPAAALSDRDVARAWLAVAPVVAGVPGPVRMEIADGERWPTAAGLGLQLERHGHPVHVQHQWTLLFGAKRRSLGTEPVVLVVAGVDPASWPSPRRATLIGIAGRTHLFVRRSGPACWFGWLPFGGPACPVSIPPPVSGPPSALTSPPAPH